MLITVLLLTYECYWNTVILINSLKLVSHMFLVLPMSRFTKLTQDLCARKSFWFVKDWCVTKSYEYFIDHYLRQTQQAETNINNIYPVTGSKCTATRWIAQLSWHFVGFCLNKEQKLVWDLLFNCLWLSCIDLTLERTRLL